MRKCTIMFSLSSRYALRSTTYLLLNGSILGFPICEIFALHLISTLVSTFDFSCDKPVFLYRFFVYICFCLSFCAHSHHYDYLFPRPSLPVWVFYVTTT